MAQVVGYSSKNPMSTAWLIFALLLLSRPCFQIFGEFRFHGFGIQNTSSIILITTFYLVMVMFNHWFKFIRDPIFLVFVGFILIMLVSFVSNKRYNSIASLSLIARFATFLTIYLYSRYFLSRLDWQRSLVVIVLSAIIPAFFGLYQYYTNTGLETRGVIAVYGTFFHPNMYGNFIVFVNLIIIYLFQQKQSKIIKFFLLLLFFLNTFLLINTFGRAALLALSFTSFIFCLLYARFLILYVIPFAFSIFILKYDIISDIIFRFREVDKFGLPLSGRLLIWEPMIKLAMKNSFIGVGPSNWILHYSQNPPHNEFLRFFVETGFSGVICFIVLWTIAGWSLLAKARKNFSSESLLVILIFLANIFLCMTSGLGSKSELQWIVWACIGLYLSDDLFADET